MRVCGQTGEDCGVRVSAKGMKRHMHMHMTAVSLRRVPGPRHPHATAAAAACTVHASPACPKHASPACCSLLACLDADVGGGAVGEELTQGGTRLLLCRPQVRQVASAAQACTAEGQRSGTAAWTRQLQLATGHSFQSNS